MGSTTPPTQAEADTRRYGEHLTLRAAGAAGLTMRVLLTAPEDEFSPIAIARRARVRPGTIGAAIKRLEELGFVSMRFDHDAPRVRGYCPRWVRITEFGRTAAEREGLTPAPSERRNTHRSRHHHGGIGK
jgi:DNA-binding MarR family transcriptional regulator